MKRPIIFITALLFFATAAHAAGGGEGQAHRVQLLSTLFLMFVAAKIGAEIFDRLRQPAVAGEILAGVLLGQFASQWIHRSEATEAIAEIGVILLMFTVGLETEPRAIFAVGPTALRVAVLGVVLPFALGAGAAFYLAPGLGEPTQVIPALFTGAALVATSVGITARVLSDMGVLSSKAARVILAAAVIDDILALLVLAIVSSMAQGGGVDWLKIGVTAVLAFGFVALAALAGPRIAKAAAPSVENLHVRDPLFVVAMALCLGLAFFSEAIGIAAIVGAFLAGMVLADRAEQSHLLHKSEALVNLFLPFFLVNIGLQVELNSFANGQVIFAALLLTALGVAGKFFGGQWGAKSEGPRVAKQIGMGMVPRGEVGIVAAQLGLAMGALNKNLFAAVLFMAVATTLIAPPFLRRLFAGETGDGELVTEAKPFRVE
jgi:Kef-type K+ transport system membrane component KefB